MPAFAGMTTEIATPDQVEGRLCTRRFSQWV
jgi:hypothetical protein